MNKRLALALFLLVGLPLAAPCRVLLAQQPTVAESQRLDAEIQKLNAERDKLKAEAASLRRPVWVSLLPNIAGVIALIASLAIGLRQLIEQRQAQALRARVDASLKAAEIAMNAPTTGQVRSRADILAVLLKDFVPGFGDQLSTLDFNKIGFASYRSRFSSLLEAISSQPEKALLLTETYAILFPEDDKNSGGRISELKEHLNAQKI
jgi:hypothetical protein